MLTRIFHAFPFLDSSFCSSASSSMAAKRRKTSPSYTASLAGDQCLLSNECLNSAPDAPFPDSDIPFPVVSLSGEVLVITAKASWSLKEMHAIVLTRLGCSHPEVFDVDWTLGERRLHQDEIVGEICLQQNQAVHALPRISFSKYTEKATEAIALIPEAYLGCERDTRSIHILAFLELINTAKHFPIDTRLPHLMPSSVSLWRDVQRRVFAALSYQMMYVWDEALGRGKLLEYAFALDRLDLWRYFFIDASASLRLSGLRAHLQFADRCYDMLDRPYTLLHMAMLDPDSRVQQAAWENLAIVVPLMQHQPPLAQKFLCCAESSSHAGRIVLFEACLGSKDPAIRIAALAAYGRLQDETFHDILSRMSHPEFETEAIVRQAAQLALQRSSASNDTTIASPLTVHEQMRRLQTDSPSGSLDKEFLRQLRRSRHLQAVLQRLPVQASGVSEGLR